MSNIFEEVTLKWRGAEYKVPPERCMRLAYIVEMGLRQDSNISVFELVSNPPVTALAMAYAAALRHAGAAVTDEDVYLDLVKSVTSDGDVALEIRDLISTIISMVLPPKAIRGEEPTEAEKKITGG